MLELSSHRCVDIRKEKERRTWKQKYESKKEPDVQGESSRVERWRTGNGQQGPEGQAMSSAVMKNSWYHWEWGRHDIVIFGKKSESKKEETRKSKANYKAGKIAPVKVMKALNRTVIVGLGEGPELKTISKRSASAMREEGEPRMIS